MITDCAMMNLKRIIKKNPVHNKVHISERGRYVNQLRILASQFSPIGHERSPKSDPQHAPTVSGKAKKDWLLNYKLMTINF